MTPTELLEALRKLPAAERLAFIEAAIRMTREEMEQGILPASAAQRPGLLPAWTEPPGQRPAPRRSLDDVELDELDQEGKEQGFLQKIFRVFTQEN